MKQKQNKYSNQPSKSNNLNIFTLVVETKGKQTQQRIRSPKFNRKSDSNCRKTMFQPLTFQNQHPIAFVSPKRQNQRQEICSKSTKLQYFQERFRSQQKHQQSKKRLMSLAADTQGLLSEIKEGKSPKSNAGPSNTALKNKCQKNGLWNVQQLEKQNKYLKKKLAECQGIQKFLIQRQNYIYDISQLNRKYLEEISVLQQTISKTAIQKQVCVEEKKKLMKQNQSLQLIFENQQNQLIFTKKQIDLLKKEIKYLIESNNKKIPLIRNPKQNIYQNKIYACLSKQRIKIQPHLYDISNLQKFENSKKQPRETENRQKTPQCNIMQYTLQNQTNSSSQMKINQQRAKISYSGQQPQNCIMKKLKQKLRYSEIQIDVLNKIKDEFVKIKDQNLKLKGLNRKYLTRIQYFTKRLSKRLDSESSLQFSLTPQKKNAFN